MRCPKCQGDGEYYIGDEAYKCHVCNGTGQVVRFITETQEFLLDIHTYLETEPHPGYHLVTIQHSDIGKFYCLFWERNI